MKGKIATSSLGGAFLQFLAYEHTLWNKSYGDPRLLGQLRSKETLSGKLVGKYSFPFSFPFPTEVNLLDKKSDLLSNTSAIVPFLVPEYKRMKERTSVSASTPSTSGPEMKNGWNNSPTNAPEKSPVLSSLLHRTECLHVDGPVPSMPQTFFERGVPESITYELSVHFIHGRFKPAPKQDRHS